MIMRKSMPLAVFEPRVFAYDPERDNAEVDQFGFINLADSFSKGIIPGGVDLTEDSFNGVSNPGTLIPRSSDIFDGLRKAQYVKSQLDRLNAEERAKVEKSLEQNAQKVTVNVSPEG